MVPFRGGGITQHDLLRVIDLRRKHREITIELVEESRLVLRALEDGSTVQPGRLSAYLETIEIGGRRKQRVVLDGCPIVED